MKTSQKLKKFLLMVSITAAMTVTAMPVDCITASADGSSTNISRKVASESGVKINSTNFPDKNFRSYISEEVDNDQDGYLSNEEITKKQNLTVFDWNIKTLKGLEYFTATTELDCSENKLTSLDLSKNPAITKVDCEYNKLTSINLTNSTSLIDLSCQSNKLTSLDVSNCPNLKFLNLYTNQLESLDLSNNSALESLTVSDNKFTSLDLTNNTSLNDLSCSANKLTSLDLSKNTAITDLDCEYNNLKSIDISNCASLRVFNCGSNPLKSLDLSKCTKLKILECRKCPNLQSLTTYSYDMIYLYHCKSLKTLNLKTNEKISLSDNDDLVGCKSLRKITLNKNSKAKTYSANLKLIKRWIKKANLKNVKIAKA